MDRKTARYRQSASTAALAAVAMGKVPGTLIIRGGTLVNVLTARLETNMDVIVHEGFIAFVGDASGHPVGENTVVVDASGRYILPGLIDSHMHVESSMVDLPSFAAGILPHGTTTICPDNHEMTNVFGMKAVELFWKTSESLPLKVLPAMPVCVPSIPGMEDAGASIGPKDVRKAYNEGWAALQGEQMNFPGVIFGDPDVHAITAEGIKAGKVLTGHYAAPGQLNGLNAFIASGLTACHESTRADEALEKASRGMYVQQRYGTAWLDLPNLVPAILENPEMDTRMFTMVTDDVTPITIAREGHLVRVLREAVRLGVPAIEAIQMVTINAAQLLEESRWIGSVSPGRSADILLVNNLREYTMEMVISEGSIVAENGSLTTPIPSYDYPDWAVNSLYLPLQTADDFTIPVPTDIGGNVEVRVIRLIPGMVYTKSERAVLTQKGGALHADPDRDLAKISMIYRHKAHIPDERRRSMGFLSGLTLKAGTALASTVSHDCHNLLVIGTDDEEMAVAANAVRESGGGIAVVQNGRVLARLSLPFAGLMSLDSVEKTAENLEKVEEAIKIAGCPHPSVEMTISLLGLIVLGELHLSNRGLVELKEGEPPRFVDLICR